MSSTSYAAVLAAALSAAVFVPVQANAQRSDFVGGLAGGILGGIIAGSIAANARPAAPVYQPRRAAKPAPRRQFARQPRAVPGEGASRGSATINASADPFARSRSTGADGVVPVSNVR